MPLVPSLLLSLVLGAVGSSDVYSYSTQDIQGKKVGNHWLINYQIFGIIIRILHILFEEIGSLLDYVSPVDLRLNFKQHFS
jgi:hypothetical protein